MKLNEYIYAHDIYYKDFIEAIGINQRTYFRLMKGGYTRAHTAYKIERYTQGEIKAADLINPHDKRKNQANA